MPKNIRKYNHETFDAIAYKCNIPRLTPKRLDLHQKRAETVRETGLGTEGRTERGTELGTKLGTERGAEAEAEQRTEHGTNTKLSSEHTSEQR